MSVSKLSRISSPMCPLYDGTTSNIGPTAHYAPLQFADDLVCLVFCPAHRRSKCGFEGSSWRLGMEYWWMLNASLWRSLYKEDVIFVHWAMGLFYLVWWFNLKLVFLILESVVWCLEIEKETFDALCKWFCSNYYSNFWNWLQNITLDVIRDLLIHHLWGVLQ